MDPGAIPTSHTLYNNLNISHFQSLYSAIPSTYNEHGSMSPAKKRKLNKASEVEERITVGEGLEADLLKTATTEKPSEAATPLSSGTTPDPVDKNKERQERFKALQARAASL